MIDLKLQRILNDVSEDIGCQGKSDLLIYLVPCGVGAPLDNMSL